MSEQTTPTTDIDPQVAADDARAKSLVSVHAKWEGDVPDTITGPRALHLATTVGFGSLQRLGHKRGAACTPASVAKVMEDRQYTADQVDDLAFLAARRTSTAAQATLKACVAFKRRLAARDRAAAKAAQEATA